MSDDQPRDRLGRFAMRLADDADAAAAKLEDPALTKARAELNQEFRDAVSGEPKPKRPRPGPDASREEWEAWIDEEYAWNMPPPRPTIADLNAAETRPEPAPSFGVSFNEMLRERRLGPKKSVEVIRLK